MFDYIGKKIKSLANVLCWVGIIGYAIAGIIVITIGIEESEDGLTALGVALLIAGPFVSWVSSFFMYGFGEIIDKTCNIEKNMHSGDVKSFAQNKTEDERIEKLERLRSQNLITEDEYQQAILKKTI